MKELGGNYHGAKAAAGILHPTTELSDENCTAQIGVSGTFFSDCH